jgi:hypothetical protein
MFDVKKFLVDEFADANGLVVFLRRRRVRGVSRHMIYKWFSRASVPGHWLGRLVALLHRDRGEAPDLRRYLKR